MNVLLVVKSLSGGGSETVIVNTAKMLAQYGYHVDLVSLSDKQDIEINDPKINLYIGVAKKRVIRAKIIQEWRLARWVKKQNQIIGGYDLVLSNFFSRRRFLPAELLDITHFYLHFDFKFVHRSYLKTSQKKANRLKSKLKGFYQDKNVISVSAGAAASLTDYFDVQPKKITTIYNFFDIDSITKLANEPFDHETTNNKPYILHPARFDVFQKRHDILFSAFKTVPSQYHLVLLTKNSDALRDMIKQYQLEDRVTVTGFQNNPFKWMKNASLVVLCSDFEGFGNVIAESLICGTAVVSTDCESGPSEILRGTLAKGLTPCGDHNALSSKILELLTSPPTITPQDWQRFTFDAAHKNILQLNTIKPL